MQEDQLLDFAERYTAAWCSQGAASVAPFYSAVVQSFMTAFPNLRVILNEVTTRDDCARYHRTLTGTNTGPGGTGHTVPISRFESWRFGEDGLIASSQGHFDSAEYRRQLEQGM